MAKNLSTIPAEIVSLYDALVAGFPRVERKGAAMPYTALNGNMFSFLTPKGALALRLPDAEREALLKSKKASECIQHGVVMKEYVEIAAARMKDKAAMTALFKSSLAYARTLKPKSTAKKKK